MSMAPSSHCSNSTQHSQKTSRSLRASAFLFVWLACGSQVAESAGHQLIIDSWSLIASEPQPWAQFIEDWNDPLRSGGDALLFSRNDIGVTVPAFWPTGGADGGLIGFRYQRYSVIRAHPDTARLYWSIRNDRELADGFYRTRIMAEELITQGVFFGQGLGEIACGPGCRMIPRAQAQMLRARAPLQGDITGTVVQRGDESAIDWQVNMAYHDDPLFGRPSDKSWGYGASLDLDVKVEWLKGVNLAFGIQNAISAIRFDRMQFTTAQVEGVIENFSQIDDGRDEALINGREETRSKTWAMPEIYSFSGSRAGERNIYAVDARNVEGIWFLQASVDRKMAAGLRLGIGFDPLWNSWSLRVSGAQWSIAMAVDSRRVNDMGMTGLTLQFRPNLR